MYSETVLRVIQALEIKSRFIYVLNEQDIQYLESKGYTVKRLSDLGFGLADCEITTGTIKG